MGLWHRFQPHILSETSYFGSFPSPFKQFLFFHLGCSQPELCAYVNAHMCAYAHDQGRPLLLTSQKSNGSKKKKKKNEIEHLEQSLA